jgi:arylsulfatase A-like enzyme
VLPEKTVTDQVAITMDLSASIARIAGAKPPKDRPFDGIDVLERLEKRQPAEERTLFWRCRRGDHTWWAVRQGDLKYVARKDSDKKTEYLFDLRHDAGERNSLLDQRVADAARLRRLLAEWEKTVQPRR